MSQTSADLKGAIQDKLKGVVVGATVTATNLSTNVSRETATDDSGNYHILLLLPGEYEVKVEMAGFTSPLRRGMTLTLGQTHGHLHKFCHYD